jgi:hypothetical protein
VALRLTESFGSGKVETGPPAFGMECARERVELRSPERLEAVLLENGREDEKASAGVHCPAASPDHAFFGRMRES